MITLETGEKQEFAFQVRGSKHGRGTLYFTNLGVHFESNKHGVVVRQPFANISSYSNPKGFFGKPRDEFRIDWVYDNRKMYYVFNVKNATQVFSAYQSVIEKHASSVSEIDAIKNTISKESSEQTFDPQEFADNKAKLDYYINLEKEKAAKRREFVDQMIPKGGVKRWNDTWFDEKNNVYVTYNRFFTTDPVWHKTKTQQKFRDVYGDECVILPVKGLDGTALIEMHHGYPCLRMGSVSDSRWFAIPTIADEMLTKEMLRDRIHLDRSQPRFDYHTESPRFYVATYGDMSFQEVDLEMELHGNVQQLPEFAVIETDLNAVEKYYRTLKEKNVQVITQLRYTNS